MHVIKEIISIKTLILFLNVLFVIRIYRDVKNLGISKQENKHGSFGHFGNFDWNKVTQMFTFNLLSFKCANILF